MAEGECFTDDDVRNAAEVCVVGQTLVHELFQDESPVGKEIRVGPVMFKVVGVLSKKGANMMGWDQDDILLAPWTSIKFRVTGANVSHAPTVTTTITTTSTLDQIYPTTAGVETDALYPAPSASEAADTPLPVRFINREPDHGRGPELGRHNAGDQPDHRPASRAAPDQAGRPG